MKWQSNEYSDWYFEQQSDNATIWIEYSENKIENYFVQISVQGNFSSSADLVVLLTRLDGNYSIMLSQGICCNWQTNLTCRETEITSGYWATNHGNNCFYYCFNR